MSDSSWPSECLWTDWKYIGQLTDVSPKKGGNRSSYCLKHVLEFVFVLGFGVHGTVRPAEYPSFTDITETSGIARLVNDHYASNSTWWLSGLHLVDLDGDGDLDLFLSAHGKDDTPATLNDGFNHFTRVAGIYPTSEIHLCYDRDEDGKIDLTMTYQDGGGQWWRNRSRPGELLFEPTGITRGTNTARRQAMIDINRDGKVDWLRGTDTDIQFDFGDGNGFFSESSHRLPVTRERDEVCVYDGALSNAEIWALYGNGSQR